ncbi:MAG: hypothetical protein H6830_12405 [Planctomycetes bacterium]|nr:hypothetical protein [Planctomycetota bacterium]HRV79841.1 hypothetical protein [Planctomycetota bacterium]
MARWVDRPALRGWLLGVGMALVAGLLPGCSGNTDKLGVSASSCMKCHNGSQHDDYSGPGMENPHQVEGVEPILCTGCHGGNPDGTDALSSHVPPPPEIGDREFQDHNAYAYFNKLTRTGLDRLPDYTVDGVNYTAMDYLQFVNPGDDRVAAQGRGCGECHAPHVQCLSGSMPATSTGIFSGATFAAGVPNELPANQGLWQDTAADFSFRAVSKPNYVMDPARVGAVAELMQFPVFSTRGLTGTREIFNNNLYSAAGLDDDQLANGQVIPDTPLHDLYREQIAFTCGDCHYGSAGANNRYGDFRSSGCTSCHMAYSLSGRYTGSDPNVLRDEPANPDNIRDPERPHVRRHMIQSVARTLPSGETLAGIDDYACAGCHQGSNRTVMQYWGIRLDQNQDVHRGQQYPANPVSFQTTAGDARLFDALVGNNTYNGRNHRQYLLKEDYDGDGRDDTPPDVHYEAGLACIDCHGSYDVHGGDVTNPDSSQIYSRMEQSVAIECESCHGDAEDYATTTIVNDADGNPVEYAVDRKGNVLKHVVKESDGNFYLTSRLDGRRHYLRQTRDTVVDNGVTNPFSGLPVYSPKASYCMGRNDGLSSTGLGPQQSGSAPNGFSHMTNMSCVSCHASWTNNCIGCHLGGEYDNGNNFSNITGDRIVFKQANADFVYQSPVFFQLGIDTKGKIAPISPNTETFFKWEDKDHQLSKVFSFTDRKGKGGDRSTGAFPALSHNAMMPHSIRGRVTAANEGPRYCVACHLTTEGLANYGPQYDLLRNALASPNFTGLDNNLFQTLKQHIGQNPGNQLNSPLWVHMVAGLGTGLFLFDEKGAAVNPLDNNANRVGSDGVAPAATFNLANVAFNLDRIAEPDGSSNSSNNHPMQAVGVGTVLRAGAADMDMSGPMGASLIQRLTDPNTGIVLDSWLDANGATGGDAGNVLPGG